MIAFLDICFVPWVCRGPPFRAHFASPFLGPLYKSFYARSTCGGAAAEIQLLWVSSATHIHHTMTPRTYCCKTGNKTISEPQLDSWEVHVWGKARNHVKASSAIDLAGIHLTHAHMTRVASLVSAMPICCRSAQEKSFKPTLLPSSHGLRQRRRWRAAGSAGPLEVGSRSKHICHQSCKAGSEETAEGSCHGRLAASCLARCLVCVHLVELQFSHCNCLGSTSCQKEARWPGWLCAACGSLAAKIAWVCDWNSN